MDVAKSPDFRMDCSRARNAPPASEVTRVALVSHQLGLSERELEPFFYVRRKGSKHRFFDLTRFANEYGISRDWLYHGYLPEHPRNLKPLKTARRSGAGRAGKQRRSKNGTPEERASNVAAAKARLGATLMHEVDKHLAAKPSVADPSFVQFLRHLGGYVVQEFGTGKEVDQIFDELIADALVTYQKSLSEP